MSNMNLTNLGMLKFKFEKRLFLDYEGESVEMKQEKTLKLNY